MNPSKVKSSVKVPNPEIVLSEAEPSDYPRIARLHALSWQSAYRGIVSDEYLDGDVFSDRLDFWKKQIASGIAEGQSGFLACDGGEERAFGWIRLDADPIWGCAIENLHVHPQGIGRRLMAACAGRIAKARPGSPLFLFVLEANHPAVGFYESLGGERAERVDRKTGDGKIAAAFRMVWRNPRVLSEKSDSNVD